ncbi:unnamed protein product, partial [Thlaspi arvense]
MMIGTMIFVVDANKDRRLSYSDLKSYMELAGLDAKDDEIKAIIRLGGGDSNGCISFDGLLRISGAEKIDSYINAT